MRILTIKQPWLLTILWGLKPVENRTKPFPSTVPIGSRIWLHASARVDNSDHAMKTLVQGLQDAGLPLALTFAPYMGAARGVVLGSVEVTGSHHADDDGCVCGDELADCCPETCSPWAEPDVWHWTLADPRPLAEPIPAKGRLGLWTPDHDLTAALDQVPAARLPGGVT